MLILSRKSGESITIGGNIQVRVLKVRGSQVQLGISAPPEIKVMRQEIVGKEGKHDQS
jgi:carbon storage regulator